MTRVARATRMPPRTARNLYAQRVARDAASRHSWRCNLPAASRMRGAQADAAAHSPRDAATLLASRHVDLSRLRRVPLWSRPLRDRDADALLRAPPLLDVPARARRGLRHLDRGPVRALPCPRGRGPSRPLPLVGPRHAELLRDVRQLALLRVDAASRLHRHRARQPRPDGRRAAAGALLLRRPGALGRDRRRAAAFRRPDGHRAAVRKRVGIVVFPDVEVLDFCGPFEVFSVTRLGEYRREEPSPFEVLLVAEKPGPILATGGLKVIPDHTLDDCPRLDILVVPGGWGT